LTTARGAPPTVEQNHELVHSEGSRPKVGELLAQPARRSPLDQTDESPHTEARIDLDEQVHVIGHHLEADHVDTVLGTHLVDQLLQAILDLAHQDTPAVLGTPDQVVLGGEHDVVVAAIGPGRHATHPMTGVYQ
jgi:hypothetical protein